MTITISHCPYFRSSDQGADHRCQEVSRLTGGAGQLADAAAHCSTAHLSRALPGLGASRGAACCDTRSSAAEYHGLTVCNAALKNIAARVTKRGAPSQQFMAVQRSLRSAHSCCARRRCNIAVHMLSSVHLQQEHVSQPLVGQAVAAVHHQATGAGGSRQPAARCGHLARHFQLVPVAAGGVHAWERGFMRARHLECTDGHTPVACLGAAGVARRQDWAAQGREVPAASTSPCFKTHRSCHCCTCQRLHGPRLRDAYGWRGIVVWQGWGAHASFQQRWAWRATCAQGTAARQQISSASSQPGRPCEYLHNHGNTLTGRVHLSARGNDVVGVGAAGAAVRGHRAHRPRRQDHRAGMAAAGGRSCRGSFRGAAAGAVPGFGCQVKPAEDGEGGMNAD